MNDISTKEIRITDDYSIFKKINGNRATLQNRVDKIKKSIQENGYITSPVICNDKMEVIDGQGRVEALKQLGLPIEYIIHEGIGIDECIAMNIYQTSWNVSDYINGYADIGDQNYIRLKKLIFEYPRIPLGVITYVLNENISAAKEIKNGEFTCTLEQYEDAHDLLDYICSLYNDINSVGGSIRGYLVAIAIAYNIQDVDKKKLEYSIHKYNYMMKSVSNTLDCLHEIESVYNKGNHNKVYIRTKYLEYLDSEKKTKTIANLKRCKRADNTKVSTSIRQMRGELGA